MEKDDKYVVLDFLHEKAVGLIPILWLVFDELSLFGFSFRVWASILSKSFVWSLVNGTSSDDFFCKAGAFLPI